MPEKFNFLDQVNRSFDRAGVLTDHDPALLLQSSPHQRDL